MFGWIQKLIDAVPQDWSPTLSPAGPEEKVLGKLPADIWKAFLGAAYASEQAIQIAKDHVEAHRREMETGEPVTETCDAAGTRAEKLQRRALLLMNAVTEAVADWAGDVGDGDLDVREEGVVLIPPARPPEGFGELMAMLMAAGGPNGPRRGGGGPFDIRRLRRALREEHQY